MNCCWISSRASPKSSTQRLEKFIIADDVQVVDAGLYYGLLSVQGPKAEDAVRSLGLPVEIPAQADELCIRSKTPRWARSM